MRLASVIVAVLATTAHADLAKDYAGRIVISPDPPPTLATELPAYVKANAVTGDAYDAIKGSPWQINLVGFLKADATDVMLEIGPEKLPVSAKKRLVISSTKLTTAAGFESNKTYEVRLVSGKKLLARATLHLRD
jgi:hypothetical protein